MHQVRALIAGTWVGDPLTRSRCSGLHRGMGTHISRVKSVDLDDWKDEQAQSILKWGNARANKCALQRLTMHSLC